MTRNRRVTPSEIASCIYDTTGEAIQSLLWIELFFRAARATQEVFWCRLAERRAQLL
jgi:hypothetical protein